MKDIFTSKRTVLLGILCLLIFFPGTTLFAQTVIEPGPPGTINETILGDTLADGSRAETHYILKRDSWYLYTEKMKIYFNLTIEAEAGDGARPIIKPFAIDGGADRPFDVYTGGLTLRGVHLDAYDNSIPAPGFRYDAEEFVRTRGDNVRLVIDDCRIDRPGKLTVRVENTGSDIFITNTVISNAYKDGWPGSATIIGKSFDVDSLVVSNCTIYNAGRFNRRDGAQANYTKIDHCTFVAFHGAGDFDRNITEPLVDGVPQTAGVIDFHNSKKVVFRNNLLVNVGFLGHTQIDTVIAQHVVAVHMIPETESTWVLPDGIDIRNNNIWHDPALSTNYAAVHDTVNDVTIYTADRFYNPVLQQFITEGNSAASLTNLEVNFVDGPRTPFEVVDSWYTSNGGNVPIFWPRDSRILEGPDMEGTLDFSYTDAALLTASTQGQPLGDLTWHDMEITPTDDDFTTITTSIEQQDHLPVKYSLEQNYPNPFNPTTQIDFSIPAAEMVTLNIYNVLGQKVATLVNEMLNVGSYKYNFDASALSSGVYIYKIQSGSFVQSRKMMILK